MKLILHSDFNANSIRSGLGKAEYSYYFVLKAFQPVLEQLGDVVLVERPDEQVDAIYDACATAGEDCFFISFSPPNAVPINLRCPTIVVFAWEFSTIPDGSWDNAAPEDDWRAVLARLGTAISLSGYTASVVKEVMGPAFPIFAIAAPVWSRLPRRSGDVEKHTPASRFEIVLAGVVIDSADYQLSASLVTDPNFPPPLQPTAAAVAEVEILPAAPAVLLEAAPGRPGLRYRAAVTKRHLLEWYREAARDLMPAPIAGLISRTGGVLERVYRRPPAQPVPIAAPPAPEPVHVKLRGIIYTTILNPADGRKNWLDILTAFCWAFRDIDDAVLIMKLVSRDPNSYRRDIFFTLARLAPFKCRVVTLDGFLEDAEYQRLVEATSFYVNASNAEGLCLPLIEFMAAGKPAIAPRHSAMLDYIDDTVAFIVGATPEHNVWPNDPRHHYTTMRQRPQWDTLVAGLEASYKTILARSDKYRGMSRRAAEAIHDYCSDEVVLAKLRAVLNHVKNQRQGASVIDNSKLPAESVAG